MYGPDRYRDAAAFRRALEQRLRTEADSAGVALNRLRKEAAFNRLLVHLQRAAPNRWALKGGFALIARIGWHVRGTKDVDANWRSSRAELDEVLDAVESASRGDWFEFRVGDGRRLQGEGDEGAVRFPVTAILDGRVFEKLSLDVNIVSADDARPIELVTVKRNPFAFIGEDVPTIPMVTPGQQLAEKLHAYARDYDDQRSSRVKDLFDMLVIAEQVSLPDGAALTEVAIATFDVRATAWPPELADPPDDWAGPWSGFAAEYPLRWPDLEQAFHALHRFWQPLLDGTAAHSHATWSADRWVWDVA